MYRRNNLFIQLSIFFVLFGIQYPIYDQLYLGGDAGEYFNNFYRASYGDLPYKDFWLLYPPGEVYFPVFLTYLLGYDFNLILTIYIVINSLIGVITYRLGILLFDNNRKWAFILTAIIFGNSYARYGSANFIPMHLLIILWSLEHFLLYLKTKQNHYILKSGIIIGVAFLFRVYLTGPYFCAILLSLWYADKKLEPKNIIKTIKIFLLGFCFSLIPIILLMHNVFLIGLDHIMLESVQHAMQMKLGYFDYLMENMMNIISDIKKVFVNKDYFSILRMTIHTIRLNIFLMYVIPFLIPFLSFLFLTNKKLSTLDKTLILTFLISGILTIPKALGRSDIQHIYQPDLPLLFLSSFILYKVNSYFLLSRKEQVIKYSLTFICGALLFSNVIILSKTTLNLQTPKYAINFPFGEINVTIQEEAKTINKIIHIINDNSNEGEFIFVTPWHSYPFYAMTKRKNPTYYDSLIDLIARPSEKKQKEICENILNKKTKLIIHSTNWGFDGKEELQFDKNCKVLINCIDENFTKIDQIGSFNIYVPIE